MRSPCDADSLEHQGDRYALALSAARAIVGAETVNGPNASGTSHLSPALEERFTEGECDLLSDALHEVTGLPVVAVGDGDGGVVGWVHAGVRMPSGDILDARGAHDPLTWLDDWAPFVDAYGEDLEGYDAESVEVSSAEIYGWRERWPHLMSDTPSENRTS
ncbi:hypothetical protein Sked_02900 [Sanguibacter keddieii DSM 10542]|uniref:Uncharacterized protein n=1 Tax=Sanguibacter keddieii (strain ATCC 51767 / DSM 10542 / NCFB 3025 / ST-74) TaxID=446469 RepID=D1BJK3_SANKS|nr:hypothetical protein [Sanguibacter keddieii]ACZ20259.1 hypothetical protein Sked_02900 [Sanguibacter keddieii DSM 10542]